MMALFGLLIFFALVGLILLILVATIWKDRHITPPN